jgi:hypothetical protein
VGVARRFASSAIGGSAAAFVAFLGLWVQGSSPHVWAFFGVPVAGAFVVAWLVTRMVPSRRPGTIGLAAAAAWAAGQPAAAWLMHILHRGDSPDTSYVGFGYLFNAFMLGFITCWIIGLIAWAGAHFGRARRVVTVE